MLSSLCRVGSERPEITKPLKSKTLKASWNGVLQDLELLAENGSWVSAHKDNGVLYFNILIERTPEIQGRQTCFKLEQLTKGLGMFKA